MITCDGMLRDGMIIQRDSAFPIWTNKKIELSFSDKTYESIEKDNKWLITLDPICAGGPFTIEIKSGTETIVFKDIYSGDLWICAGQSNMEMQMNRLKDNYPEEWNINDYPIIRQYNAPQQFNFSSTRAFLQGGNWICASKETLNDFTAAGWFFAKNLYKKYLETEGKTVPIGLINTAWGGTPIESWMSRDALAEYPAIIADGEQYAEPGKIKEIQNSNAYSILEWETNLKNEDVGFPLGWENQQTYIGQNDNSDWDEINLPGEFAAKAVKPNEELKDFCGSIWLFKDFDVSSDFAKSASESGAKVWLGTIVDADTVYINGKEIGNTPYRYPPRKYTAKGVLKEGKNRIVIRVTVNNGQGAVTPDNPFCIFTDKETIDLKGIWKYKIGAVSPVRPEEFFFHYKPMGNFNAMISPMLKYPLKGVIWYQGESNESRANEYADLFKKMILDWREKSKQELPFLFVQLPIFSQPSDNCETHSWALIREAQSSALSLPYTGMAAAWEKGEWNDLHPVNKKDVGYRLFLAAEKIFFKTQNTSPGAMVQKWELKDNKLCIYFTNCGSGLKNIESPQDIIITVISNDGNTNTQTNLPAEIISKDCICIDFSFEENLVQKPKKVLYAWANNPKYRALYNNEGLPVLPFRITL